MTTAATVTHSTKAINGIDMHVVEAGDPSAQPIVLLHGFPEFWYGWHDYIEPFAAAGYHVLVPDQRGYNLTSKPAHVKDYAIGNLVEDIAALIRATGRTDAIVVGHDWGAGVAWMMAILHPELVQKLAILNVPHPAVMLANLTRNPRQMLRSWYIFLFQIPGLPERLVGNRTMLKNLQAASRPGAFTDADLDLYWQAWQQPGAMTAMINWYRAFLRFQPKLPADIRVHQPTRIIWGAQDIALGVNMAHESVAWCDNVQLDVIETATHFVQHDEPERVKALLLEFAGSPVPTPA